MLSSSSVCNTPQVSFSHSEVDSNGGVAGKGLQWKDPAWSLSCCAPLFQRTGSRTHPCDQVTQELPGRGSGLCVKG